jgi:multidrug efflux system membrane fusion protein
VRYREGAQVAAGAVLFTIDARPYHAVLARANAELLRAKARAELARDELVRSEKLLAGNAIPRVERDTAAATARSTEADVQAAAATVALARLDVEFTQVRAPFAGRAGLASVTVGDYVTNQGAPTVMTTVVSADPVHVYFTGDEQAYLRFAAKSDQAPVSIGLADEEGYPHAGKVDFVDNAIDASTGTIRMRAVVPNPDGRLTPGLYARVHLAEGATTAAVLIDEKAVMTDQDRRFVYVVGAGAKAERRDVTLGPVIDQQRIVTSGLKAGDQLIVSGIQKIFPGAPVAVAPAAPVTEGKTL